MVCSLFVVACLLCSMFCCLRNAYNLLLVACIFSVFAVRCLLVVVCSLFVVGCLLLRVVRNLLFVVRCVMFVCFSFNC